MSGVVDGGAGLVRGAGVSGGGRERSAPGVRWVAA